MLNVEQIGVEVSGKKILEHIHFSVKKGEVVGIVGPNGSGKSTLLRALLGLIPYNKGDIQIEGSSLKTLKQKEVAQFLSYVPQQTNLDFSFTAYEIVKMGFYIHSKKKAASSLNQRVSESVVVHEVMNQLNIWHLRNEWFHQLSGGQKQLVFIAKALVQNAPYIFLDEPISALDIYYQLHILELLKGLKIQNKGVVIVLHDLNLAARYCDKLLLLECGSVRCFDKASDVLTEHIIHGTYHVSAYVQYHQQLESIMILPYLKKEEGK